MYKEDLALNNPQSWLCYKPLPNKTKQNPINKICWRSSCYIAS